MGALAFHGPASAQDVPSDEDRAGFFRYLPAAPEIKLPKLNIVPFWTDDLKKARKAYNKGDYDRAMKFFSRAPPNAPAKASPSL